MYRAHGKNATMVSARAHSTRDTMQLCLLVEQERLSVYTLQTRQTNSFVLFHPEDTKRPPQTEQQGTTSQRTSVGRVARSVGAENPTFSMDVLVYFRAGLYSGGPC